jgi:uncharacterized protein
MQEFYHRATYQPCYTAASMADCDGALHPRALQGILLLNKGKYFEAHEELEAAWKDETGRIRELYQGILEAAVTYLHITRGNFPGAVKVYGRSMRWLKDWPEFCRGVDVGQLRRDLDAAIAEVHQLGATRLALFDRSLLKPVIWKEGQDGRQN